MKNSIEILILEENINNANSLICELVLQNCNYHISHVTTAECFIDEVMGTKWDLIISEFSVSDWTVLNTLKFLKENKINSPLVVVTEPQSEEIAVECIKMGAADYFSYPNIRKVSKTVSSILNKKTDNNSFKNLSKADFFNSFETMYESLPMPVILYDDSTLEILYINQFAEEYFRLSRDQIVNYAPEEYAEEKHENMIRFIPKLSRNMNKICNWRHYRKDGTMLDAEINSNSIQLSDGNVRLSVITDLSNRKRSFEPISLRLN